MADRHEYFIRNTEAIRAEVEQIAIYTTKEEVTWEFERDEGIFTYTVYPLQGTAQAEWIEWDDDAQDWTGRRVPLADIRHLIPARIVMGT